MRPRSICIIGPDGSGKTTINRKLENILQINAFYLGYGEQRTYMFSWSRCFGRPVGFSWLERLGITFDDSIKLFRILTLSKKMVILDRFPSDNIVNTLIDRRMTFYFHYLIFMILPKPDLFILLHGDERILAQRKGEISRHRIKLFIIAYKLVLRRAGIKYLEVDTTKTDINKSVCQIRDYLNGN